MASSKKDNYWIPLADLMTVLMVIFLFISISYMIDVKSKQAERDKIFEDFKETKIDLLKDLQTEFNDDFRKEKWNAVLDKDLSIKFVNESVLFDYNKSNLKSEFQTVLTDFFPRYLNILMKPKYIDKIAEVRIEGHTDIQGDYIYNLQLSQDRTRNVMKFLLNLDYYKELENAEQNKLRFWLTANGLSFGRTLDVDGNLTEYSNQPPDDLKCRRVEFRIVTTSDKIVEEAIKQISK
ncbi:MAG: OmpA family protein [Candidatus Kapabacteria bacterium]|nr:OmpA family protein [Candidatus Kapabacteria bacterium]